MKSKYVFVTVLLLAIALLGYGFTRMYSKPAPQRKEEELVIVTSFYPVYVAASNVAGDVKGVTVENLSQPQTGCLHDFQLTPGDMMLLSRADAFVINGGGMEGFLGEVAGEYPNLTVVNAGEGIFSEEGAQEEMPDQEVHLNGRPEESEDSFEEGHQGHHHTENAHAWMSIPHYMEQVAAIRDGLVKLDPKNRTFYEDYAEEYLSKIQSLKEEAESLKELAFGQSVILLHEAFWYLAEDYGLSVEYVLNLDEEQSVSAGEVADLIGLMEEKNIQIILAEDLYGRDLGDTIEEETGIKVYYLDTLTRGDGSPDSWLRGMEENISILKEALGMEVGA